MQDALASLPALPLHVRLLEGRLLVTASAELKVPVNAELLSIDGRTPVVLANEFMPYLRADGNSDGKRLSQIDSNVDGGAMDRLLPLLHPPATAGYVLRFRPHDRHTGKVIGQGIDEVTVAGMPVVERENRLMAAGVTPENTRWRFAIEGDTATMTLPTFAFWQSDFDWRSFLQRSFDTLAARRIDKLILDLRQNEGGDDAIGNALQSHLLTTTFVVPAKRVESAYERAPYDLARFMDTWDFSFFDRTGQVVRGEGRNWLLRKQPADERIEPVARPYRGRVVLLVGPRMSSAGFLIARNLKASGSATLIGQATGGNLRGLNGGELAWLVLPSSGVSVDIPLIGSFSRSAQPNRGVLPDIAVRTRLEDAAAGIDPDIVAAKRWLARNGARP
ncbi:S41 family peptidase [Rhodanobacter sp. AS-Z3]|uniref:S41 family peptidase n=1 Tax=Rhodanobacter sp. AS-Z3 TaxID=3031330 RepID=UPI002479CE02|nr:S41 family peptidase [Rhodanobacter sp. AS-Z3]WEN14884.1 S41 family peptidase [Rhodanobacter sp. AS-Z3]